MDTQQSIIFLGLAERARQAHEYDTPFFKWEVLGLKDVLLVNFVPTSLGSLFGGFALRTHDFNSLDLSISSEAGVVIGGATVTPSPLNGNPPLTDKLSPVCRTFSQGWTPIFLQLHEGMVLPTQGRYYVTVRCDHHEPKIIGEFRCLVVDPPPLTSERIAAIKSSPYATKAVRGEFGCSNCPSKVRVYAALERTDNIQCDGYTWYQDIPELFVCTCGKTKFDLSTVKRNFFSLLYRPADPRTSITFQRQYEKGALENTLAEFVTLLNLKPAEERLQKFIENHPILSHQFPASQLRFKPPIFSKYKADFAVLTPQQELIFIEIERADIALLTKGGGQAAPLLMHLIKCEIGCTKQKTIALHCWMIWALRENLLVKSVEL